VTPTLDLALWLQLGASLTTIAATWFTGNKSLRGPQLALVSQIFWWSLMITSGLWGLLPLNIVMLCMHVRTYNKWSKA
jgi:hypothetical protein